MAYQTFSVSSKDMQEYYLPQKNNYDKMIDSILAVGYGQMIYNYKGPGDSTLNSYNIWNGESMVVVTADESMTYTEAQAGPSLWGVSSQEGINFLNGVGTIEGLTKLKYCNSCNDRNGLPPATIKSFSDRFGFLKELKNTFAVETGYIFYDYELPVNQRWYPSVFDSNLQRYYFKNYLGINKSEIAVASETSIPVSDITLSIENSKPVRPITATSSVILNCCDGRTTYVIDGVYDPGAILFTPDVRPYQCYQVTKNTSDRADNFYTWEKFGGKCTDCTTTYGSCKGR
jgi:hypothetical protein